VLALLLPYNTYQRQDTVVNVIQYMAQSLHHLKIASRTGYLLQ